MWVGPINVGTVVVKGLKYNFEGYILPSFDQILSRYQSLASVGITGIELCEFNEKKKKKRDKFWPKLIQLNFNMYCATHLLQVE